MSSSASRLLLLLPTTTYRTEAFVEAAHPARCRARVRLRAAEHLRAPGPRLPHHARLRRSRARAPRRSRASRSDDRSMPSFRWTISPRSSPPPSASGLVSRPIRSRPSARRATSTRCAAASPRPACPCPRFRLVGLADDPAVRAAEIEYPCVLKPLSLSASRGVIRANDAREFVAAFRRISAILETTDATLPDDGAPRRCSSRSSSLASRSRSRGCSSAARSTCWRSSTSRTRSTVRSSRRRSTSRRRVCPRPRRPAIAAVIARRLRRARTHRGTDPRRAAPERARPVRARDRRALDRRAVLAHADASARA